MRLLPNESGSLGLCWCCHPAGRNQLEMAGNPYGCYCRSIGVWSGGEEMMVVMVMVVVS